MLRRYPPPSEGEGKGEGASEAVSETCGLAH